MTIKQDRTQTQTYSDLNELMVAVSTAAATSFGKPVTGILYSQGGRRFISSSLPVWMLLSMARRDSARRKDDPSVHRNRPLAPKHVAEIAVYLRTEPHYLMPPIMLNSAFPLQTFVLNAPSPAKTCFFVMPPEEYLYVTDGQHRLEALRQVVQEKPEMASIGVTIVEEDDIDKVHQDFYDAAQTAPLSRSPRRIRRMRNALTRYTSTHTRIAWQNREDRVRIH